MTPAEMLAEAREAHHRLLTGTAEVDVTFADRRVRFNDANRDALAEYITALEASLASATEAVTLRRTPIRVVFG